MRTEEFHFLQHRIGASLEIKKNGILSVPNLSIIRKVSLPFFPQYRRYPGAYIPRQPADFEVSQNMTADFGQHFRLVGAE